MLDSDLNNAFKPLGRLTPLALPIGLGHFLPWFTLKANAFPLEQAQAQTIPHPPQLEDFRHWKDARSDYQRTHRHMPEIGIYDSRDPGTLHWQFACMCEAGLAGMIINWYGQNSAENIITLAVLRALQDWNQQQPDRALCYCFSIDSQAQRATEGKTPASLEEDLAYIQQYLLQPGYLCRDDNPVFLSFPYEDNLPVWINALDQVFGKGQYDFHWMNQPQGQGETGCFLWVEPDEHTIDYQSPTPWRDPDNCGKNLARSRYRLWSQASPKHAYGVAGVWPGFDDTLVAWAWKPQAQHDRVRPRVISRHNTEGSCYRQLWETYLDALADQDVLPLPIVQIVTWNDWAETTQIEPSADHGNQALHLTRQYLNMAQHHWNRR